MKRLVLLSMASAIAASAMAGTPPAVVKVNSVQRGGGVAYQYTVINNSDVPILGVTIGLNSAGDPNLKASTWQSDIDNYWANFSGTGIELSYVAIDPSRCVPFSGMVCALKYETDSDFAATDKKASVAFDWIGSYSDGAYSAIPPRPTSTMILPHSTSSIAELIAPAASSLFTSGYARINFGGSVTERSTNIDIRDGKYLAPLTVSP